MTDQGNSTKSTGTRPADIRRRWISGALAFVVGACVTKFVIQRDHSRGDAQAIASSPTSQPIDITTLHAPIVKDLAHEFPTHENSARVAPTATVGVKPLSKDLAHEFPTHENSARVAPTANVGVKPLSKDLAHEFPTHENSARVSSKTNASVRPPGKDVAQTSQNQ